jgi:hypothetical protein
MELNQSEIANNGTTTTQQPNVLDEAISAAVEAVSGPSLTPAGVVASTLRWVSNMGIHPAHRAKVRGLGPGL